MAQEHQATTCTDAVLTAVCTHVQTPRPTYGKVVVACVEEEWHSLPARLFAELLLLRGWKPSFLGASIPTDSLKSFLINATPTALALSCSVAMNLTGAADCIDAAHSLGIPVIVGGRGFGNNDLRARKLGADEWAYNLDDACNILSGWSMKKPRVNKPVCRIIGEDLELMAKRRLIMEQTLGWLRKNYVTVAELEPGRIRRLEQDLAIHLRFVEAALLTADPNIYLDFITWDKWLAPGVAPVDGLSSAIVKALSIAVPSYFVATTRLFNNARQHLEQAEMKEE